MTLFATWTLHIRRRPRRIWLLAGFLLDLLLRPWRWRQYVPPKRRLRLNGLHGVISQNMSLQYVSGLSRQHEAIQNKFSILTTKYAESLAQEYPSTSKATKHSFVVYLIFPPFLSCSPLLIWYLSTAMSIIFLDSLLRQSTGIFSYRCPEKKRARYPINQP
jgi:hypothetical protein